jgi:hypothetical protein
MAGLDIGRNRGRPLSHYTAPFEFIGKLLKVTSQRAIAWHVSLRYECRLNHLKEGARCC